MMNQRAGIAFLLAIGFTTSFAVAGDLTPPPGPITATDRVTLSDADPVPIIITKEGSYVLTSNIVVPAGDAIDIQASNVTLDLNGFTIEGGGADDGIEIIPGLSMVVIRNGFISGFARGVFATGVTGLVVEGVQVTGCNGNAFEAETAVFRACIALGNPLGYGFVTKMNSTLIECRSISNGLGGFDCSGGVLERCVAIGNAFSGITVNDGGIVRDCVAKENNNGIYATGGSSVIGCLANGNQFGGIEGRDASLVESCQARGNGLAGVGSGIRLSLGSRAVECVSALNADHGYELDFQCVVDRCEAHSNTKAGVFVSATDNRITANHLYGNSPNLDASGALATGNLILRNTANGGYSVGVANDVAPINLIGVAGALDNITY